MPAIEHILFPVDFSRRCHGAAPFVEAMASHYGARLTLMSVGLPFSYAGMDGPAGAVIVDADALKGDLQAQLDLTFRNEFKGLTVQRIAALGDPATVLTDFAHAHDVSLIMMPTHGYGPFRSLLLGSVTAKVLHDARCPVWTDAHMEDPPVREHLTCRAVLCAVDGTPKSAPLMAWAAGYAKDQGASLRLVHVISRIEGWPEPALDREFEENMRQEARKSIERHQKSVAVQAPLCVEAGDIASAVREEALRHGSDLIVIGRGVLHETLGRLRTHAYGIIRHAPCPVLSV
jgi:nucleotide-binding universal stress UspA family protein